MKPEQELEPGLGVTDVLLIELMKSDDDFSSYFANVDMNVRTDVKRKFRKDSGTWLPRLVAERATLYCERKQNLDTKTLRSKLYSWIYSGVFITIAMLLVFLFFHAIGTTQWLFSANTSVKENTASIGKLIWLLVIPPLLSILPFVACINLLLRKQKANSGGSGSMLSKLARKLSIPGVIEGAWHVLQGLRGSEESRTHRSIERFAERKGEIATTLFVAISNALVLLLSIAVLLAVSSFLTFTKVNYSWESSLATEHAKSSTIPWIIKFVPFVEPPNKDACDWAFNGKSQESESNVGDGDESAESQLAKGSGKTEVVDGTKTEDKAENPTVSIKTTSAKSIGIDPQTAALCVISRTDSTSGPLTVRYGIRGAAKPEVNLEKPTVEIHTTEKEAMEGVPPTAAQFEIRRDGTPSGKLRVKYNVGGSAKPKKDYKEELSGTVVIPDGSESTKITITPLENTSINGKRTVELSLLSDRNYEVGSSKSVTLTTESDKTLVEGRSTTENLSETFVRSIVIPNGEPSTKIEFKLSPSRDYEVGISKSATVAAESDKTTAANGTNPEKPTVFIKTTPANSSESDPLTEALFVISRTGSNSEPLTVKYEVAVPAGNSDVATGSAIIPKGRDSITLKLNLLSDQNYELGASNSATLEIVDNDSIAGYRSEWSWFVLRAMFVLVIVPRVFIGCLSAFLVRRSWLSLIPNADDPDVEKIVDNVMGEKVSSSTITNVPEFQPREEHPASAAKPELLSKPRRVSNRLIFVAYSLPERDIAAIRKNGVCKESELNMVDGAAERSAFLNQLGENAEIDNVIILVRATTVPDKAFSAFLSQTSHNQGGREGAMKMLIVGAKEHLERVAGDTRANRSRVDLWRSEAFSCGMKNSDVLELDLELDDIRSRLATWLTESVGDAADARVKMAGKFPTALSHVEKELISACSRETISSSAGWETRCDQIREQVIKIYANEYQRLLTDLTDTSWGDVATDIAPDIGLPAGEQATLGKVLALRKYFETLSPKWMLAGAIAGVGATAALPLLVGGTVGLPVLLAALPYAAAGGAGSAHAIRNYWQSRSDGDLVSTSDLPEYEGMNLDVVTRVLLLLVLLLEYQENSHDVLARKVEQQLQPLGEVAIDSPEKMSAAVGQLRQSLCVNLEVVA